MDGFGSDFGNKAFGLPQTLEIPVDLAEAVRFELTDPFEPPVFKTGAIDHSATLPAGGIVTSF